MLSINDVKLRPGDLVFHKETNKIEIVVLVSLYSVITTHKMGIMLTGANHIALKLRKNPVLVSPFSSLKLIPTFQYKRKKIELNYAYV